MGGIGLSWDWGVADFSKQVAKQGVTVKKPKKQVNAFDGLEFTSNPLGTKFKQTPEGETLTGGLGEAFKRNLDLAERATDSKGRSNALRAAEQLKQRSAPRAAAVAASRASQRNTSAINKAVTAGRKKVKSASAALPRIPSGLLSGEDKRSLLL